MLRNALKVRSASDRIPAHRKQQAEKKCINDCLWVEACYSSVPINHFQATIPRLLFRPLAEHLHQTLLLKFFGVLSRRSTKAADLVLQCLLDLLQSNPLASQGSPFQ